MGHNTYTNLSFELLGVLMNMQVLLFNVKNKNKNMVTSKVNQSDVVQQHITCQTLFSYLTFFLNQEFQDLGD